MVPISASNSDMYSFKYGSSNFLPKIALNYIFIVNDKRRNKIKTQGSHQIESQFGAVAKEREQNMILDTKSAR